MGRDRGNAHQDGPVQNVRQAQQPGERQPIHRARDLRSRCLSGLELRRTDRRDLWTVAVWKRVWTDGRMCSGRSGEGRTRPRAYHMCCRTGAPGQGTAGPGFGGVGPCNPSLKQVSRTTLAPVDDDDDELPEEGRQLDRLGVGARAIKFSARCRRADGASCLLHSAGCWLQAGGNGA